MSRKSVQFDSPSYKCLKSQGICVTKKYLKDPRRFYRNRINRIMYDHIRVVFSFHPSPILYWGNTSWAPVWHVRILTSSSKIAGGCGATIVTAACGSSTTTTANATRSCTWHLDIPWSQFWTRTMEHWITLRDVKIAEITIDLWDTDPYAMIASKCFLLFLMFSD